MINGKHDGKHGQGIHSTEMGADKSAENTPNAPKFICPICLPKPKSLEFWWKKASLGVRSPYWSISYGVLASIMLFMWTNNGNLFRIFTLHENNFREFKSKHVKFDSQTRNCFLGLIRKRYWILLFTYRKVSKFQK